MKKVLLWLFLLGSICIVSKTYVEGSDISTNFYKIMQFYYFTKYNSWQEFYLSEYTNYKQCKEFTKVQKAYQILDYLWFLGANRLFLPYFLELATLPPENIIQQSLFPYWNPTYAEQGKGVQLFCKGENDNFYQMGTLQLKGYIVFQDMQLQGIDLSKTYDGSLLSVMPQGVYFVISEFKDDTVEKLPYLKTIDWKKGILLWCYSREDMKFLFRDIDYDVYRENFGNLRVNVNTVNSTYSITQISIKESIGELFKKSFSNPEKEITINAQLTPNVIFDHGLDIPCENSRIQDIEIVDDAGL